MSIVRRLASTAIVVLLLAASTGCSSSSDAPPASGSAATTSSSRSSGPASVGSSAAGGSAGCGRTSTPVAARTVSITSSGMARTYLLDVPPAATRGRPAPVVVDLHGNAEGAELHRRTSDFAGLGRRKGFITVTPLGRGAVPFFDARPGSDDVRFVAAVLDDVEAHRCVDLRRVYAAGFSNGAFLSSTIACELADRFAAVAPVSGIREIPGCSPSRPVPVITFHGTADEWIRFRGGSSPKAAAVPTPSEWTGPRDRPGINALVPGPFEPIPTIVTAWARRNGCDPKPTSSKVSADTTLLHYRCPKGADVAFYRVTGGGHSWPGSRVSAQLAPVTGPTTFSIDATDLIWRFFAAPPLR